MGREEGREKNQQPVMFHNLKNILSEWHWLRFKVHQNHWLCSSFPQPQKARICPPRRLSLHEKSLPVSQEKVMHPTVTCAFAGDTGLQGRGAHLGRWSWMASEPLAGKRDKRKRRALADHSKRLEKASNSHTSRQPH